VNVIKRLRGTAAGPGQTTTTNGRPTRVGIYPSLELVDVIDTPLPVSDHHAVPKSGQVAV